MGLRFDLEQWLSCCHCARWAGEMRDGQPYADLEELLAAAARSWACAAPADVREAVAAHPRIGERTAAGSLPAREQAGTAGASAEVMAALADGNRRYERRFGMTYLVRAAGRSAQEMVALLHERLANDPVTELAVVAQQQGEITALRLRALAGDTQSRVSGMPE